MSPDGGKITCRNAARSANSYGRDGETEHVYLTAGASYDMLPSTENLWLQKPQWWRNNA